MKVPLFVLPTGLVKLLSRPFLWLGERIAAIAPGLKYDLKLIRSEYTESEYIVASALNACFYMLLVLVLVLALYFAQGKLTDEVLARAFSSPQEFLGYLYKIRLALLPAIASFFLFFGVFLIYPRILVRKIVESVDKDLAFALRDLLIQITAGVSLYQAIANVARAGYGEVSKEFAEVAQAISAGESQESALERLANKTKSEFLKRALWQMSTAIRTGTSLRSALSAIVENYLQHQRAQIRAYSQELNLWILLFSIFAVAIPGIGITLLLSISFFSGISVSETTFIALIAACVLAQLVLVEYIRVKRPVVAG